MALPPGDHDHQRFIATPMTKSAERRYTLRINRRVAAETGPAAYLWEAGTVEYKLELIVIPVSDIDRAKDFYARQAGFRVDVDHRQGEDFRVVQLTPPGSACSIALMRNPTAAGSLQGLHLVVPDIDQARADLTGRGVAASEPFHFGPDGQAPGPHPERASYGTFLSFSDPDGNSFLVQEVKRDPA